MNTSHNLLGVAFEMDDVKYRIIYIKNNSTILVKLDTNILFLTYYPLDEILYKIDNFSINILKDENFVIDFSKMSDKEKAEYEYKLNIINRINEEYGPEYIGLLGKQSKPLINQILQEEKGKLCKATLWSWIRKYLQSGLNYNSLVDIRHHPFPKKKYEYTKKTGRPTKYGDKEGLPLTDEVLHHFADGLAELKSGRYMTIEKAYNWMIRKYYSYKPDPNDNYLEWLSASERPTQNQFYHYVKTHYSKKEKNITKYSEMEERNNNRLLFGSSRTDAYRPGKICECDALEADVDIIYDDELGTAQCVGRPTVYMMIDVYTSMIVAISASYHVNSFIGLTNLFLNLGTDKVEFAKKYDIDIQPDMWRSCFIPDTIRCDRGSDFKSNYFGKVCDRIGIKRDLVTPGTGSYKGLIEESFASFQKSFRANLERKGLITKRHDSNHHKEAILTLDQFTQLLIHFVISHNQKQLINYPMTADMLRTKGFKPIPAILWDYGCKKYGSPKYINKANYDQFYYDLLVEKTASLTRSGVILSGLTYVNREDSHLLKRAYEAGDNVHKIEVRCDPRSVAKVFYMHDNMVFSADLNLNIAGQSTYLTMSWERYRLYNHKRMDTNNEGKKHNAHENYKRDQNYDFVIDNASSNKKTYTNTKDIKKHRKKAMEQYDNENNVSKYIDTDSNLIAINSKKTEPDEYVFDDTNNIVVKAIDIANNTTNTVDTNNSTSDDNSSETETIINNNNESSINNSNDDLENATNDMLNGIEEHRFKGE